LQITKSDWKWQLTPSGRFAHRKEYVEQVGKDHSLETIYYEPMNDFRREGAVSVRGHIFIMKKNTKDSDEL
jgi:predicted TPR repeat methyltransferase